MPPDGVEWKPHAGILSFEELTALCAVFAELGIRKVKVTGGEPLVRRGLPSFIAALKRTAGIEQVTLTTNGLLLGEHLPALLDAGLDAVNISLDTLDPVTFGRITRYPYHTENGAPANKALEQILSALRSASSAGLRVKVNCVPIAGVNEEDILPLAALARELPIAVRFIELMPLGRAASFEGLNALEILSRISEGGVFAPINNGDSSGVENRVLGNGPAVYYAAHGWQGQIGIIAAISRGFCERCNRLRLSADGYLSPCLSSASKTPLRALVRGGDERGLPVSRIPAARKDAILETIRAVIFAKPQSHSFSGIYNIKTEHSDKTMWNIGG
jgi:cyclic pyranopterin phosphate synthase